MPWSKWQDRSKFLADSKYRIRHHLLGYPEELWYNLKHLGKPLPGPSTGIAVFGGGRSGTTLLVSLLDNHPDVQMDGEILKSRYLNPAKIIKFRSQKALGRVYGFKLLSYQLMTVQTTITDKGAFLKALTDEGYRLVYVERQNKARQLFSLLFANYQHQWHRTSVEKKTFQPVEVPISYVASLWKDIHALAKFEHEVLQGLSHFAVQYETQLANPVQRQQFLPDLFKWLDLDDFNVGSKLKKVSPAKPASFLLNYEEITTFLIERGCPASDLL